jgi:hypothetical protein
MIINTCARYGDGYGYDRGDGTGYGNGYGNGNGTGYGNGHVTGYGYGNGNGYGHGTGYVEGKALPINLTDNDQLISSIILAMHSESSALCRASVNQTEGERTEYERFNS